MTGSVVCRVNIYYAALSRKCLLTLDLVKCPHFTVQETKIREEKEKSRVTEQVRGRPRIRSYVCVSLTSLYQKTGPIPFFLGP